MSDVETTSEVDESAVVPQRRPRWFLIGIVAAGTIVVALLAIIGVRSVLSHPSPPLGVTAAADLQLGSCLAEADLELAEYTVVDCSTPHPQQVVGTVDMSLRSVDYTQYSATEIFVREVCERFVEYSLFVRDEISAEDFETAAIAVPTEQEFEDGRTEALCSIAARDGSELTTSLYRPMP